MQLSVLVSADYVLQVEMVSYSNPSNIHSDGLSCDPISNCDTFFTYCLLPRASTAEVCPNTAPGFTLVSSIIRDGAEIDFSQLNVFGLPNPFNLTGISTAWEVMTLLHFNLLSFVVAGSSALYTSG